MKTSLNTLSALQFAAVSKTIAPPDSTNDPRHPKDRVKYLSQMSRRK
jgi:hypothetical protein